MGIDPITLTMGMAFNSTLITSNVVYAYHGQYLGKYISNAFGERCYTVRISQARLKEFALLVARITVLAKLHNSPQTQMIPVTLCGKTITGEPDIIGRGVIDYLIDNLTLAEKRMLPIFDSSGNLKENNRQIYTYQFPTDYFSIPIKEKINPLLTNSRLITTFHIRIYPKINSDGVITAFDFWSYKDWTTWIGWGEKNLRSEQLLNRIIGNVECWMGNPTYQRHSGF